MKLNLGCGQYRLEGFTNVDRLPQYGDVHWDVLNLPIPDNSVEEIYAGHVFEHLTWPTKEKALCEWHRVLVPGGLLTITVPDFEKSFDLWRKGELTYELFNGIIYGNDDVQTMEGLHKLLVNEKMLHEWLRAYFAKTISEPQSPHAIAYPEWQTSVKAIKA